MKKSFFPLFSIFYFLFSSVSFAGGPILRDEISNSGTPLQWRYEEATKTWVVEWWSDPGPLTSGKSHDKGIEKVKKFFEKWKGVKLKLPDGTEVETTALRFDYKGKINLHPKYQNIQDIDATNHTQFTLPLERSKATSTVPTVIIFDTDGSIIMEMMKGQESKECPIPKNCIAGLGMTFADSQTKVVQSGFVVLNGWLINGNPKTGEDNEMEEKEFDATILHEIGHLLNLDHTQVNADIAEGCSRGSECTLGNRIPTMYPDLKSYLQDTMQMDDRVTVSWLYSSQAFRDNFCIIKGEIKNAEGKGMQGVNVIARNISDPVVDARSMVSGVLFKEGTENGEYILAGIVPKQNYEVFYEELNPKYTQRVGSSFAPLDTKSPTGFGSGLIRGDKESSTVRCEKGGEVITMPSVQMPKPGAPPGGSPEPPPAAQNVSEKKGWCSLNRNQAIGRDGTGIAFAILFFSLTLFKLRIKN